MKQCSCYLCKTIKRTDKPMKIQKKTNLVKVNGMNWQQCQDGHRQVLHREHICPVCEFRFIVQCEMQECYDTVFEIKDGKNGLQ